MTFPRRNDFLIVAVAVLLLCCGRHAILAADDVLLASTASMKDGNSIVSIPIDLRNGDGSNSITEFKIPCADLFSPRSWETVRSYCENSSLGYSCDWFMRYVVRLRDTTPQCSGYKIVDEATIKDVSEPEALVTLVGLDNGNDKEVGEMIKFESSGFMGPFAETFRSSGSDKIGQHGYHRFYPRYIDPYRNLANGAMLEIGVAQNQSLMGWLKYLPHAYIYGVDIDFEFEGDRYRVFKADQGDDERMREVMTAIKHPVFLVIDDGSHDPDHQIRCFDYLFRDLLIPGGTYIIEDIETSYWKNGTVFYANKNNDTSVNRDYGWRVTYSAIEVFKSLADDVNREFLSAETKENQDQVTKPFLSRETRLAVSTVTFGHNCVIVVKKTAEEYFYAHRDYRMADMSSNTV